MIPSRWQLALQLACWPLAGRCQSLLLRCWWWWWCRGGRRRSRPRRTLARGPTTPPCRWPPRRPRTVAPAPARCPRHEPGRSRCRPHRPHRHRHPGARAGLRKGCCAPLATPPRGAPPPAHPPARPPSRPSCVWTAPFRTGSAAAAPWPCMAPPQQAGMVGGGRSRACRRLQAAAWLRQEAMQGPGGPGRGAEGCMRQGCMRRCRRLLAGHGRLQPAQPRTQPPTGWDPRCRWPAWPCSPPGSRPWHPRCWPAHGWLPRTPCCPATA